jgi:hypothetical protein
MAISFLGIFPAGLIVHGLGHPVRLALLIPGVVLVAAVAAAAAVPVRAGIGVTPERILIRAATGRTTAIPWADVTGFKATHTRKDGKIFVLTSGGGQWQTSGYAPAGSSRWEEWQLVRALEDERIARTPGAAYALPPRPPPPAPGQRRVPSLWASLVVAALLILFGTGTLYQAVTRLGPAVQAAHGGRTAGYFIPQRETTGRGAAWYGEFRLPDGDVTRRDVGIQDLPVSAVHAGVPVAARDTGDPAGVYPRDDPGAWHYPADVAVMTGWFYGWALVLVIRAAARRRGWSRRAPDHRAGDPPPAAGPDAAALARDAAAALAGQHGWSWSPLARDDKEQPRSLPWAGQRLGQLDGVLGGRRVTVVFWERFTSVVIVLPAGTVPKVRIKADRDSGQLTYEDDVILGQRLMTPPAGEVISRAGFTAVSFNKNALGGGFHGVLTADEVIDAVRSLDRLLAAMPADVLRAHGVFISGAAPDGDHS